jgi:periplasmic protein TonB
MNRRLFEDLVVSTPAPRLRSRAAVLPVSVALHAGAIAIALTLPVLRPAAVEEEDAPRPVWEVIARKPDPPPVRSDTPPRVATIAPRRASEPQMQEAAPTVAAPGPAAPVAEPDSLPVGDPPAPCFVNCDGPLAGEGTGNGPIGTDSAEGPVGFGTGPVRVSDGIQQPVRTVYVAPVYPPIAITARESAVVVLDCTIDTTGHVTDVRILSGHPLLDAAVIAAVRQWRYTPTRLNGVPVPVLLTVTVRFKARS